MLLKIFFNFDDSYRFDKKISWNELGLESNRLPQILEDVTEEAEKATVFLDFI